MAETKTPIARGPSAMYSPLPWRTYAAPHYSNVITSIRGPDDKSVCQFTWPIRNSKGTPQNKANAEFIVRAVNSHQDLLDACKEAWTSYGRNGDLSVDALQKLEAAIHKAERPAE